MDAYTIHPLADLIPVMTEAEYARLKADMAENGLVDPITLYEDRILDGRHRMRLCQELGIEPRFDRFDGDSAVSFVVSRNLARRHLSRSQLAMVAADLLPYLHEQARTRMAAAGAKSAPGKAGSLEPALPPRRATDDAAALTGASSAMVKRAQRLKREDPELAEEVMDNKVALSTADEQIRERNRAAEANGGPPRKPAAPSLDSKRGQEMAVSAKKRVEYITGQLDAYEALEDLRVELAVAIATQDERDRWCASITRARSKLALFAQRIKDSSTTQEEQGNA